MASLSNRILRRLRAKGLGKWVCTPTDFLDLGTRAAVDQTLSRLTRSGVLRRVGRGLYDLPRYSDTLKRDAPPHVPSAVDAICRRDGIRIVSDGMYHANNLKLTTAVPAKYSFYTDGVSRDIQVGGWTIHLVHKSAKLMSWCGKPSGPAALALLWLGRHASLDPRVVPMLRKILPEHVKADLAGNLAKLPGWARPIAGDVAVGAGKYDGVGHGDEQRL